MPVQDKVQDTNIQLGEVLREKGIITTEAFEQALARHRETGRPLGELLIEEGDCGEQEVLGALEVQLGVPRIRLSEHSIAPEVLRLMPREMARAYRAIPVKRNGNRLTVAMVDPMDLEVIDDIRFRTGLDLDPVICSPGELEEALEAYYSTPVEDVVDELEERLITEGGSRQERGEIGVERLRELVEEAPIVRLTSHILRSGLKARASDIHLEPREAVLLVKFRVDGRLRREFELPPRSREALISRMKIMAGMDIAERRRPQDGRFQRKLEGRDVDFRVSTVPTIHGEKVAVRILDPQRGLLDLGDLGADEDLLSGFRRLVQSPWGMVLVTGPTGSGKTTTLYATLGELNSGGENILTIEDPVEYRLENVNQIQVNESADLTFHLGLRSILRQDPDIIMVGEIRDRETARTAVQAALTVHLVLSTLHTNTAAGTIGRLLEMGIQPFLLASALRGVIAQRLVRLNCPRCRSSKLLSVDRQRELGLQPDYEQPLAVYRGRGCVECDGTGYRGRTGIFELLVAGDAIRELIMSSAPSVEIEEAAVRGGMRTLVRSGLELVIRGRTSIDELLRVISEQDPVAGHGSETM